MNVWTDGETMVVLGARGLSVHGREGERRVLGEEQLGMSPLSPSRSAWRWARRRMLAVTPGAERALFLNGDEEPVLAALDGTPPEILPLRIVEAIALDGDRYAAVHVARVKGRDVARLGIGALPGGKRGKWAIDLDPARPTRVEWPTAIWAEGVTPPWSRGRCSTSSADLRLDANRFGVALADSGSGTIAVVRPGGRSFECVLRVPAQAEGRCWASCTERGVVVGLCVSGREGAIVRFDKRGKALAHVERYGLGPGHVTDEGELVYAMVGEQELRSASPESLEDEASHLFGGEDATGDASIFVANGGSSIALGLGHHVIKFDGGVATGDSVRVVQPQGAPTSVPPMDAERAASSKPPPVIERVRGAGQLSLDPTRRAPEWSFEAGAPFEIRVPVVNMGGAEAGLYVEVAGDAVDRGLIAPESVEVAGHEVMTAAFAGARPRATIAEYAVLPGGVLPDAKKVAERFANAPDDMFFTVVVRGRGLKAGQGLLTVRVGFVQRGSEGSLMRGRSISVA